MREGHNSQARAPPLCHARSAGQSTTEPGHSTGSSGPHTNLPRYLPAVGVWRLGQGWLRTSGLLQSPPTLLQPCRVGSSGAKGRPRPHAVIPIRPQPPQRNIEALQNQGACSAQVASRRSPWPACPSTRVEPFPARPSGPLWMQMKRAKLREARQHVQGLTARR